MTEVSLTADRSAPQGLMFGAIIISCLAVIVIIVYTNKTLHSIEKNLPTALFSELNSLAATLDDVSAVVSSARIAAATNDPLHVQALRSDIAVAHSRIVELRNTYVANNMVNASALHAVLAPAIADLQNWLSDGVSGFAPESPVTLSIIAKRINEAFHKAAKIKNESQAGAYTILDQERSRLETFQQSVNLLFLLTAGLACMLIFLLFRQIGIKNKEIVANEAIQQQNALLTSLLHHIPLGIAVWDKQKTILHLNPGFSEITGYTRTDLRLLSDWPKLAYPDPQYRQQTIRHWKTVGRNSSVCEYRLTCKDGHIKDIEFRTALLPDGRGISTLTDVSERNKNEKALQESRLLEARAKKNGIPGAAGRRSRP